MKKTLEKQLHLTKQASIQLAKLSSKKKVRFLLELAKELEKEKVKILLANEKDVINARKKGKNESFINRLTLTSNGFDGMISQLKTVAIQKDPIGEIIEQKILANGVHLVKKRFAIGVIFVIYESRPNVTIDAIGICIKSGNAVILKAGSESIQTNKMLSQCIDTLLKKYDLLNVVTFLHKISHDEIEELLTRQDIIDVVIPRGSEKLTSAVAAVSRIPILYHSAGGARMYIDKSANIKDAINVAINAKTQRTGVCNALDCILIHKDIGKEILSVLVKELVKKGFEVRADKETLFVVESEQSERGNLVKLAKKEDFQTEFLDSILAIKIVDHAQEAITFIKDNTHGHTEILMSNNKNTIEKFIQEVDVAGVMINCSSRLHDGGQFEMGAEMGTATGKLHARGPVGVKELTTYKWIAYGKGQVRGV